MTGRPFVIRAAILPLVGYAGYPLAIIGATLVFATSSAFTLDLVGKSIGQVSTPMASNRQFSLPPVEQIGTLGPARTAQAQAAPVAPVPESSITTVAPPEQSIAVALAAPTDSSITALEPPNAGEGQIGGLAVNVRAAPSKDSARIGVLNAGAPIRIGENVGGWIHVWFAGGDGWVYQSYIASAF